MKGLDNKTYIYFLKFVMKSFRLHKKKTRQTKPGLEIATDTVANASTTFYLATKNSSLVATLATMFL